MNTIQSRIMRKIALTLATMVLCTVASAQNIKHSFMGMSLGEKITIEGVTSAMGPDAVLNEATDNFFDFANVSYLGIDWTNAIVGLDKNSVLRGIAFTKNFSSLEQTKEFFEEFRSSIPYKLEPYPLIESAYASINDDVEVLYTMDDEHFSVSLSFFAAGYLPDLLGYLLESIYQVKSPLQTNFLGLTIGDKVTEANLIRAVGNSGSYIGKEIEAGLITYSFSRLSFGGRQWDNGEFVTSDDGTFILFNVSTSFDDSRWNKSQRREADQLYENTKASLVKKYGDVNETSEDGKKSFVIAGENLMTIRLSNERLQSRGGAYRRYVQLSYMRIDLVAAQRAKSENEF